MEVKTRHWIEEIVVFRDDQLKMVSENYETIIENLKDEIQELQLNLDRATYKMEEIEEHLAVAQERFDGKVKELEMQKELSKNKDLVIKTQSENLKMLENNIKEFRVVKEELEINLNANIVNYKMREDEIETLLMVVSGVLVNE